jgi:hypothetical protein
MLQSQPQDPALDNLCDTFPPLSAALSKGVYFVVNLILSTHLPNVKGLHGRGKGDDGEMDDETPTPGFVGLHTRGCGEQS